MFKKSSPRDLSGIGNHIVDCSTVSHSAVGYVGLVAHVELSVAFARLSCHFLPLDVAVNLQTPWGFVVMLQITTAWLPLERVRAGNGIKSQINGWPIQ